MTSDYVFVGYCVGDIVLVAISAALHSAARVRDKSLTKDRRNIEHVKLCISCLTMIIQVSQTVVLVSTVSVEMRKHAAYHYLRANFTVLPAQATPLYGTRGYPDGSAHNCGNHFLNLVAFSILGFVGNMGYYFSSKTVVPLHYGLAIYCFILQLGLVASLWLVIGPAKNVQLSTIKKARVGRARAGVALFPVVAFVVYAMQLISSESALLFLGLVPTFLGFMRLVAETDRVHPSHLFSRLYSIGRAEQSRQDILEGNKELSSVITLRSPGSPPPSTISLPGECYFQQRMDCNDEPAAIHARHLSDTAVLPGLEMSNAVIVIYDNPWQEGRHNTEQERWSRPLP